MIRLKLLSPSAAHQLQDAFTAGVVLPLNLALANDALIIIHHVAFMFGFDKGKSQVNHITDGT